ncbi:hypothetical protein E4U41_001953 [Claviceps citrina]|nr:hypothetical protein E4U41_001953 [Claviceps citrina]
MAKHLSSVASGEDDRHETSQSGDAARMATQLTSTSCRAGSRRLLLEKAEHAYVTASIKRTNASTSAGHHQDGEAGDEDDHDHARRSYAVGVQASLAVNLAVLKEEWIQSCTNQLYAQHLASPSQWAARFRAQQRAGAVRYPGSLPLQKLDRG